MDELHSTGRQGGGNFDQLARKRFEPAGPASSISRWRTTTMTKNLLSAALAVIAGFAVGSAQAACEDNWKDCAGKPWVDGDSTDTPLGSIWWPHPIWGEGDQAGSTNWYKKPEVVMRALGAVKEGMTYRLGHEYHSGMPMFGQRKWVIRIPASPTGGPVGQNKIIWHDEFLATEIGQAGTQFDGLGHVGVQVGEDGDKTNIRFYNGYTVQNMAGLDGLQSMAGLDGLQNTAGIDRLQDGEASLGALSGGDTDQPFSPTEAGYAATATSDGVLEGVRQGAIDVASKSFGTAAKLAATAITGVPVVGTIRRRSC